MRALFSPVIVFVISLISILFVYFRFFADDKRQLPVYSPAAINVHLVDSSLHASTQEHRIANFSLINQNNETVTQERVRGKIYVAEFFFATCPDSCPLMQAQMQRVAKHYQNEERFRILSFTVHPEKDTPEKLLEFSKKYNAQLPQWAFLTGEKKQIYELARKSYFLMKQEEVQQGDGGTTDFIHTNNFVLIDEKSRIRGYYDGTSKKEVNQLIKDIDLLLKQF